MVSGSIAYRDVCKIFLITFRLFHTNMHADFSIEAVAAKTMTWAGVGRGRGRGRGRGIGRGRGQAPNRDKEQRETVDPNLFIIHVYLFFIDDIDDMHTHTHTRPNTHTKLQLRASTHKCNSYTRLLSNSNQRADTLTHLLTASLPASWHASGVLCVLFSTQLILPPMPLVLW